MIRRTTVLGIATLLLVGCASTPDAPGGTSDSPSTSPSAAPPGNGTLYSSAWDMGEGSVTISGHPIAADGSLGTPVELLSGPADDTSFPGVVDAHTHVGIYAPLDADAVSESQAAVAGGVTAMLTYVRTGQ